MSHVYLDYNSSTPIDSVPRAAGRARHIPRGGPYRSRRPRRRAQGDHAPHAPGQHRANNEVGTVQQIADISRIVREYSVLLHTEAARSAGKILTDVGCLGVDLLSVAGHEMNAPEGVGALYVRRDIELEPRVYGAGHEGGRRAGTESAPDSRAWEAAAIAEVKRLRDLLWMPLHERSGDEVVLNGHPDQRLPNTLSVAFVGRVGAASTRPAALPA